MKIEELNLSARTFNCLKRARIDTVEQLAKLSDEDLMCIRCFGQKSLDEVRAKIKAPRMTVGDRIRAMSDEELAQMLFCFDSLRWCKQLPDCVASLDTDAEISEAKCIKCILAWLRKSADLKIGVDLSSEPGGWSNSDGI